MNHFHDPTKPLDSAGLDNSVLWHTFEGNSTVLWAESIAENHWDLEQFYEYLRLSFTSPDGEKRMRNLSRAFRAAGHMMHLLEDMAVPAHVRNELLYGHTSSVKARALFEKKPPVGSGLEQFLQDNPGFVRAVGPQAVPSFEVFSDYYDTGTYRDNRDAPVGGLTVGLAEFTNSNFFSEVQAFHENSQVFPRPYPNPKLTDVHYREEMEDLSWKYPHLIGILPPVFYSWYAGRSSPDPERNIEHIGRVSFVAQYLSLDSIELLFLDDECYRDYAEKLVPRAVGYAAGLLEFLFRGDIEFELDGSTGSLSITNNSSRDMDGTFSLYYDSNKGARKENPGWDWDLAIAAGETAVVPTAILLPRDLGVEKTFTVVFRGDLGQAEGIVTGRTSSFSTYGFSLSRQIEYSEMQYPEVSDSFFSLDPGSLRYGRSYGCGFTFRDLLSEATISRSVGFALKVLLPPDVAKDLGFGYTEGVQLGVYTNTYNAPGVVDYFKVSTGRDRWTYVYDSSGIVRDEGWGGVTMPPKYTEGIWKPGTGYIDLYRGLTSADNLGSECLPEEWSGSLPSVTVELSYTLDPSRGTYVPDCANGDSILARAGAICAEYADFYDYTLQANGPYQSLLSSPDWRNYGFELRVNRLQVIYPKRGDGVIYDGPVTFTKHYGSDELMVQ